MVTADDGKDDVQGAWINAQAAVCVALPGQDAPESTVVKACAQMLNKSL